MGIVPLRLEEQLVAVAVGKPDHYTGKRAGLRYTAGVQLDITTDPSSVSAVQIATMHNASEGGFSFWTRTRMTKGDTLFVREFSSDKPNEWVRTRVCHCTQGIKGFLVGAEFTPE